MAGRYWIETLGCPKNQVDSDKLAGVLLADGLVPADSAESAELVVVNTCAFIEAARQESVDVILAMADARAEGARLVVTGCLAERYGDELARELPEVDLVAGFGQPLTAAATMPATMAAAVPVGVSIGAPGTRSDAARLDLLNLPRPPASGPWAYVKVAEGCDRACGFCAIPSFRGRQRSRSIGAVLDEVDALGATEVVLVAQDLASYGRDIGEHGAIHQLVAEVAARVERTRLLYLYPSELTDRLVDTICATGIAYFDLSLQHVSRPLLRRMRRWGDGKRFQARIDHIRALAPDAAFRSSFIVGYPGETEEDHDQLLRFVEDADLDWAGFFSYSSEVGTYAAGLDGVVAPGLVSDRLAELTELQDAITARKRVDLIGARMSVLVDAPGVARSHREAPEIDGIIEIDDEVAVGSIIDVVAVGAAGPDLQAVVDRCAA